MTEQTQVYRKLGSSDGSFKLNGKYLIIDPYYIFRSIWYKICQEIPDSDNWTILSINNFDVYMFRTKPRSEFDRYCCGDGECRVDAGFLSFIPENLTMPELGGLMVQAVCDYKLIVKYAKKYKKEEENYNDEMFINYGIWRKFNNIEVSILNRGHIEVGSFILNLCNSLSRANKYSASVPINDLEGFPRRLKIQGWRNQK